MTFPKFKSALLCAAIGSLLAGCVAGPAPSNLANSVYAPGQVAWNGSHQPQGDWITEAPVARGAPSCEWIVPRELDIYRRVAPAMFLNRTAPLGPGDRLEVREKEGGNPLKKLSNRRQATPTVN